MVNKYDDGHSFYDISFNKLSNNMKLWAKVLDWLENEKYLLLFIVSINKDNSINFNNDVLKDLEYRRIQKIRSHFRDRWLIKRLKLSTDSKYKRYLNPILESYGRMIQIELIREFSEENIKLWYKWNNRVKGFTEI